MNTLLLLLSIFLAVLCIVFIILYMQLRKRGSTAAKLDERISKIEQSQNQANLNISELRNTLTKTDTATGILVTTTQAIQTELTRSKEGLTKLQTYAEARQKDEQRVAESIKRLETIIAGTQSKGTAGENILEAVFAKLPAEWQVRNFRVGNKSVEFGLRLPNELVLPIDSKWPATNLLEDFAKCEDVNEQKRLKTQIESKVREKANEAKKYIDPNLTVDFALVAIPDAVFDLCSSIQPETLRLKVVLINYSMFVPYLLLVFHTILRTSQTIDLQKLKAYLHTAQDNIQAIQEELEGRFPRALTMLANSRTDMSAHLSKINSGLTNLQIREEPLYTATALDKPEVIDTPDSTSDNIE